MVQRCQLGDRRSARLRDRGERVARPHDVDRAAGARRWARADRHAVVSRDRAQRPRPDDGVGLQVHRPLVLAQRGCGLRAHVPVESTRVHTAARQQELQHGDVPAEVTAAQRARAEEGTPERPERRARPRVGDAEGQVVAALERAHGRGRARPGDPVDLGEIEAVRAQGDLQARDLRVSACRGDGRRGKRGDRQDDDPKTAHQGRTLRPAPGLSCKLSASRSSENGLVTASERSRDSRLRPRPAERAAAASISAIRMAP